MELDPPTLARLNANRLYRTLGIEITEGAGGCATSRMTPAPPLCWPQAGQPHGGILFTQLDTTMATAVMSLLTAQQRVSTIAVDIQYPNPARGEYFVCAASSTHRTRRMAFVRAETRAPDGTLVALGQGTFRVFLEGHAASVP